MNRTFSSFGGYMKTFYLWVIANMAFSLGCFAEPAEALEDGAADDGLSTITSALTEDARILYSGDRYQHYFPTAGGRCVFQTTLGTTLPPLLTDSVLWLYGPNSSSTLIAYNDDYGTLASRIERFIEPGIYYPTVGGYSSATGSYSLEMNCYAAVHYQAHVGGPGWLAWGFDGFTAGTVGQSRAMEAVRIELKNMPNVSVRYTVHVGGIGWMGQFYDGQVAGTTGQHRAVEAIRIWLENAPAGCGISYQAQVAGIGWMGVVSNGGVAGTTGQNRRAEALRVWLTGACN